VGNKKQGRCKPPKKKVKTREVKSDVGESAKTREKRACVTGQTRRANEGQRTSVQNQWVHFPWNMGERGEGVSERTQGCMEGKKVVKENQNPL